MRDAEQGFSGISCASGTVRKVAAAALCGLVLLLADDGLNAVASVEAAVPEKTFAVIDGEPVSQTDFDAFFFRYMRGNLYHGGSRERLAELRSEAAERFILERLLVREADRRNIAGDPKIVEQEIEKLEARYESTNDLDALREQLPRLRRVFLEETKIAALIAEVGNVADPDESTLRGFYVENIDLFTLPKRNRISVLLIGVPPWASPDEWREAEAKGEELFARVRAGADFAELVRDHSVHETAREDGDLGLLHEGELSDAVEDAIDAVELGSVTSPVRVLEGIALFKITERLEPEVQSFDSVGERALTLYQRTTSSERWNEFVSRLRERADVRVNEPGDHVLDMPATSPQ